MQVQACAAWFAASLLLFAVSRPLWMEHRELICMATGCMYSVLAALQGLGLLPVKPDHGRALLRSCLLQLGDAALAQVPVRSAALVAIAMALAQCSAWSRGCIVAGRWRLPLLLATSAAWHAAVLLLQSWLQSCHVAAFTAYRQQQQQQQPAVDYDQQQQWDGTAGQARQPQQRAVAGDGQQEQQQHHQEEQEQECAPRTPSEVLGSSEWASCNNSGQIMKTSYLLQESIPEVEGHPSDSASSLPSLHLTPRPSCEAGSRDTDNMWCSEDIAHRARMTLLGGKGEGYVRALKELANGPSSYVLLSQLRDEASKDVPHSTSVQLYMSYADPSHLPADWLARTQAVIAEGAPGWRVSGASARRGSLIVHLDLDYVPPPHLRQRPAGCQAEQHQQQQQQLPASCHQELQQHMASSAEGTCSASLAGMGMLLHSETLPRPPESQHAEGPRAVPPLDALDAFLTSLGPDGWLRALGLPPMHADCLGPMPAPLLALQHGDRLLLESSGGLSSWEYAMTPRPTAAVAAAGTAPAQPSRPDSQQSLPVCPAPSLLRSLLGAVRTALRPPAVLQSAEYEAHLARRVAGLHLACGWMMVGSAVAFFFQKSNVEGGSASLLSLLAYVPTEVLTVAVFVVAGRACWEEVRCSLIYWGTLLQATMLIAVAVGLLPPPVQGASCSVVRWFVKLKLAAAMQVVCMQAPVHRMFARRVLVLAGNSMVMRHMCYRLPTTMWLWIMGAQAAWEVALFAVAACLQASHLATFRRQLRLAASRSISKSLGKAPAASEHDHDAPSLVLPSSAQTEDGVQQHSLDAAAGQAGLAESADTCAVSPHSAMVWEQQGPIGPMAESGRQPQQQRAVALGFGAGAGLQREQALISEVQLSTFGLALAPGGRPGHIQLSFVCSPSLVDELQVVVRHKGPAAAATGRHAAARHSVVHALCAPPMAHVACGPRQRCAFLADLTLAASAADLPGLAHVELWRGRTRVGGWPLLLAAQEGSALAALGARSGSGAAELVAQEPVEAGLPAWMQDVQAYASGLAGGGHASAARQFVEELGTWMASLEAHARGMLPAGMRGNGPRVANVLYFHDPTVFGSSYSCIAAARGSSTGGDSRPSSSTLRQLLLVQGRMLLAVAVEAGCCALAGHVCGLMGGALSAPLAEVVQGAATPVTQLPLLHVAAKSGSTQMVDLVAAWLTEVGCKDTRVGLGEPGASSADTRANNDVQGEAPRRRSSGC